MLVLIAPLIHLVVYYTADQLMRPLHCCVGYNIQLIAPLIHHCSTAVQLMRPLHCCVGYNIQLIAPLIYHCRIYCCSTYDTYILLCVSDLPRCWCVGYNIQLIAPLIHHCSTAVQLMKPPPLLCVSDLPRCWPSRRRDSDRGSRT